MKTPFEEWYRKNEEAQDTSSAAYNRNNCCSNNFGSYVV